MGFSGAYEKLPFTKPLPIKVDNQQLNHSFLVSKNSQSNLLGRDLLVKLGASILCSCEGIIVTFPTGNIVNCSLTSGGGGQWLLSEAREPEGADIYWGELNSETPGGQGLLMLYSLWKPWVLSVAPYMPPIDPPHVTLFYDRNQCEWYQESFETELEGRTWDVKCTGIWVGKEGVVGAVDLTNDQQQWYRMGGEAKPHVTLAVHPEHQAKDLGPMTKRLAQTTDWIDTQIPGFQYSNSQQAYKINTPTGDTATLQHRWITRWHGREKTDHESARQLLDDLPDTLWSAGPTDVGFCSSMSDVTFDFTDYTPIWRSQYPNKSAAEAGITDTIEGLIAAGVLEPSESAWNTPILPVEKQNTGKFRMAHDLRLINSIVHTPTLAVPNPYTALTNIPETSDSCLAATRSVLSHLHEAGFKVSKSKLQICRPKVTFLGRVVSTQGAGISSQHRSTILHHPKPRSVQDMLSFLGLAGFSRHFVPAFAERTALLRDMVKQKGSRQLKANLDWTADTEKTFIDLKSSLALASDLATPNYEKAFYLDVSESNNTVNGVLFQKDTSGRVILLYLSIMLDQTEKRHPACTRYAAGLVKILQKTAHIVMGHPLTVLTSHTVMAYVNSLAFTMSPLRQDRLLKVLTWPNLTFTHRGINMADCMMEGEPHECEVTAISESKVRPDLRTEPMTGEVVNLYTDGCCFRTEAGELVAG
ncbi:hypothetical protein IRJ41_024809, partial [Triplophysa rosa]